MRSTSQGALPLQHSAIRADAFLLHLLLLHGHSGCMVYGPLKRAADAVQMVLMAVWLKFPKDWGNLSL